MIDRLLRPMKDRLNLMMGRAIVRLVRDSGELQLIQADRMADEPADDLERFGFYGFYCVPQPGAEAIVASIGGSRAHGVVIGVEDRRYRLKDMKPGEVALADDLGQVVYLTREGIRISTPLPIAVHSAESIALDAPEITATANRYTIDADDINLTGNVAVGGNLSVDGESVLGEGADQFVKRADGSNATKVKAL